MIFLHYWLGMFLKRCSHHHTIQTHVSLSHAEHWIFRFLMMLFTSWFLCPYQLLKKDADNFPVLSWIICSLRYNRHFHLANNRIILLMTLTLSLTRVPASSTTVMVCQILQVPSWTSSNKFWHSKRSYNNDLNCLTVLGIDVNQLSFVMVTHHHHPA